MASAPLSWPNGTLYHSAQLTDPDVVVHDLCNAMSFVQDLDPHASCWAVEDWLEHDRFGLIEVGRFDGFADLFARVGSVRSLVETTPDDDLVRAGLLDTHGRWYIRYRVEWDHPGNALTGSYELVLASEWGDRFEERAQSRFRATRRRVDAQEFIRSFGA